MIQFDPNLVPVEYGQSTTPNIRTYTPGQSGSSYEDGMDLAASEFAYTDLTESALLASTRRLLTSEFKFYTSAVLKPSSNYNNSSTPNIIITYNYVKKEANTTTPIQHRLIKVVPFTEKGCGDKDEENYYKMEKELIFLNIDARSLRITIKNNTDGTINVKSLDLSQSQDIQSGQLTEVSIYSPTLEYADRYNNGWSVKFRENELPLEIVYKEDANNQFCGVDVRFGDSTIFIPSRTINEEL